MIRATFLLLSNLFIISFNSHAAPVAERGPLAFHSVPDARYNFNAVIRERIDANIDGWLLRAPAANPGMLEMFRLRDRRPAPQLVPWAGEFAGKYLISAVQALRMSERAELREHVAKFVAELIATQAEDGYLGPFPKARRLLGEWDLWGHYHVLQGLLAWHDQTGDAVAQAATRKAADLICVTYLDGSRRVFDAGSPEMNMAVAHVLAELHRRTGEARYLRMTEEIIKDWERAGDYLRTGVSGVPFFKTPLPRWESLHDLQALAELWRITGDNRYREAFASHWRTIREYDRRNSGAFSGGEQATGNAFAPTAIETCCTIAWMALSIDMLRLTGDPAVADELELSTLNGALGAQHPSGRWWTYNTPMDGERKASAHEIVFQARAGTPELNCCSVNAPRALGMLSEWAVMRDERGLVVNWHGPMQWRAADGKVTLHCETSYPANGRVVWRIQSAESLQVRFRIPAWAKNAAAQVAGETIAVQPGSYLNLNRHWRDGDTVQLDFPMPLRVLNGEREQTGKVSLYRGPLLLAYDQRDNPFDEHAIPRLDLEKLSGAKDIAPVAGPLSPWVLVDVPTASAPLRLRDFANAGAAGTRYRSWLRVAGSTVALGPNALAIRASLRGEAKPEFGTLIHATKFSAVAGPDGTPEHGVQLNGRDEMLVYALPEEFGADFTVAVRVRVNALPAAKQIGHVFSAWGSAMDDPLRLVIDGGRLFARIEAGRGYGTDGIVLPLGEWHQVAAVKAGAKLTMYLDGEPRVSAEVPASIVTQSNACALGGNPLYTGTPEFLGADFSDFSVHLRAFTADELRQLAR